MLSGGERGLLSVAFPAGYATRGHFYLNYTRKPDGATVIARYHASADQDVADHLREEILLVIPQPFAIIMAVNWPLGLTGSFMSGWVTAALQAIHSITLIITALCWEKY